MKTVSVTGSAGLIGKECVIRIVTDAFKGPGFASDQ